MNNNHKEVELSILYSWLPAQQQFHENKAKFRAYIGGIGAGKTYAGCMESILYQAIPKAGSLGVVVAPTYPMLRDATMRTFFSICPREIIKSWTKVDGHLTLINGSEILFRSADNPDRLRGPTITWFYLDEAAYCKAEAWDIMIGRLREAKHKRAAFVTGTPRGFNWVYEKFAKTKRQDYEVVHAKTKDNIHLPQDYVQSLQNAYTGTFALQELDGAFVAFEGLVYPDFNRFTNIVPGASLQGRVWKQVVCGIDFGWTNPTAFIVVAQAADGSLVVLDEIHRSNMRPEDLTASAKVLKDRWQVSRFYGDPSSPDYIDLLNRAGISTEKANNAIFEGIAAVSAQIKHMKISDECQKLIWELERYRYPEKQEGKIVKEEPLKIDDHSCDALRYATLGLQRPGGYTLLGSLGNIR
jgi:PBSX family phage terminase large subunit